jgi:hypothetical protein
MTPLLPRSHFSRMSAFLIYLKEYLYTAPSHFPLQTLQLEGCSLQLVTYDDDFHGLLICRKTKLRI